MRVLLSFWYTLLFSLSTLTLLSIKTNSATADSPKPSFNLILPKDSSPSIDSTDSTKPLKPTKSPCEADEGLQVSVFTIPSKESPSLAANKVRIPASGFSIVVENVSDKKYHFNDVSNSDLESVLQSLRFSPELNLWPGAYPDTDRLSDTVVNLITDLYQQHGYINWKAEQVGKAKIENDRILISTQLVKKVPLEIKQSDGKVLFFITIADKETSKAASTGKTNLNAGKTILRGLDIREELEREFRLKNNIFTQEKKAETLNLIQNTINLLYQKQGFVTSEVTAPSIINSELTDSTGQFNVEIQVNEPELKGIIVENSDFNRETIDYGFGRLANYIYQRLLLGATGPVNTKKLEDQLRLLRDESHLFSQLEASLYLKPQDETKKSPANEKDQNHLSDRESCLIVRLKKAPIVSGSAGIDNFSPPAIGSVRFGADFNLYNLISVGDQTSLSYYFSHTGGAEQVNFSYGFPLNSMNGRLQARTAISRNRATDAIFQNFDIRGTSDLLEVSYRQPIIRHSNEEVALSLGFTYQNGQTFLFDSPFPFGIGPDANGISRTSMLSFGQEYLIRWPESIFQLRSSFNLGLGIFDATINDHPVPDGRFFSWLGQAQFAYKLNRNHLITLQGELQLTPNSLLPSQQFVLGGGQSLRGYRQNALSGDNGFRVSLEDRIPLHNLEDVPTKDNTGEPPNPASKAVALSIAPFFDTGMVWNQPGNPNFVPATNFFASVGLGFILETVPPENQSLPRLTLRVDYAIPLVSPENQGSDLQDAGLYFNLRYQF